MHDAGDASDDDVIGGDAHEPLTVQGSVQPVPSTGLVDRDPNS